MRTVYLDNNATTRVDPAVLEGKPVVAPAQPVADPAAQPAAPAAGTPWSGGTP